MPSSTSSSNPFHRVPKVRLWHRLGASLLVVAACFGAAEIALRVAGHRPSVRESPMLWSLQYKKIESMDTGDVVLLGDSRMQMGFSIDAFRTRYPNKTIAQLAFAGTTSNPTLHDLADNEDFDGVVIYAATEYRLAEQPRGIQEYYIQVSDRAMPIQLLEARLRAFVQQRLAVLAYHVSAHELFAAYRKSGAFPLVNYHTLNADRVRQADFSRADVDAVRSGEVERSRRQADRRKLPAPVEWLQRLEPVEQSVRKIHERGGRVVFVRFPTDGEHKELDAERNPKSAYWDAFAARTEAYTVHFLDYETLSRYECPDNSHLDQRDMPVFTNDLLDILESEDIL